jgi:hypothetical protein
VRKKKRRAAQNKQRPRSQPPRLNFFQQARFIPPCPFAASFFLSRFFVTYSHYAGIPGALTAFFAVFILPKENLCHPISRVGRKYNVFIMYVIHEIRHRVTPGNTASR